MLLGILVDVEWLFQSLPCKPRCWFEIPCWDAPGLCMPWFFRWSEMVESQLARSLEFEPISGSGGMSGELFFVLVQS